MMLITNLVAFRYFTGKFYYYAVAYIPGFLASSMAVLIEKPNRRSSLAFYVANVASEALFRIYVARGFIRPVNNGQVYIFTLSIATIMFLAKKYGFEDDPLSAAVKLIVGSEEASKRRRKRHAEGQDESEVASLQTVDSHSEQQQVKAYQSSVCCGSSANSQLDFFSRLKQTFNWLKFLLRARHDLCPHQNCSCSFYVGKTSIRAFLIGYSAQLGLKTLTKAPQLYQNPKLFMDFVFDTNLVQFGLFLSSFSGLYKASNCLLRWTLNRSSPETCFAAALLAGPSMLIYPSPTVALYVLWKCLEALFHEAVRKNLIRNKNLFVVVLYGLATSQLFYSALMDPRYMKKSYMAFLDRISKHKLHMVNRSVLDVFGTEASSGYEDFFPDLHPKFMSRAFLASIWIWMIEQKVVAKRLSGSSK